jgi:quinol-cytochrome oxidoreductase complex cytochrome b subunit
VIGRGGTPIEAAPLWALAIFWAVLTPIVFTALVGLSSGLAFRARWPFLLAGGGAVALLIVVGLKRQRPWRRPTRGDLADERPFFARFSTWLWVTLLVPNILHGVLVLTRPEDPPSYLAALLIGAFVSVLQGGWGLLERRRTRST